MLLVLALSVAIFSATLQIDVDDQTGSYTLSVNGKPWLKNAATGFVTNNHWYSSDRSYKPDGGQISVASTSSFVGVDEVLGSYKKTTLMWKGAPVPFETDFLVYDDSPAAVLVQRFPSGASNTSLQDVDDVCTAFPVFEMPKEVTSHLNYLTWKGVFCDHETGRFHDTSEYTGGHKGGPVILYDKELTSIAVGPASTHQMTASMARFTKTLGFTKWASGVEAAVEYLPVGYEHTTVILAADGVREAAFAWGDFVLASKGRSRHVVSDDTFLEKLGYWTDNGAYYYYIKEPGKNYEETILDVWSYDVEKNLSLPVKNIQYDSWWYYRSSTDGGVTLWEPRPDIFPDGLEFMNSKLQVPVALHNRYFAEENDYQKDFAFWPGKRASLPKTKALFTYIMTKAIKWGMTLYEQDWLDDTWERVPAIQHDVSVGPTWLVNMASAAKDLGLTVQYCMPYPVHMLQTLSEVAPVVTHARASNDYGWTPVQTSQWKIGFTSLFYYPMLGIVPFKDNTWTTQTKQTGCKYDTGGCVEPNPVLEIIVSCLSMGPVGFSDKIGLTDSVLVMETSRADGMLLKADLPALPLNAVFKKRWDLGLTEEVWETKTCLMSDASAPCWHFVLGADLHDAFELTLDMLSGTAGHYVAVKHSVGESTVTVVPFDASHSLILAKSEWHPIEHGVTHTLYQIAPLLDCRYSFVKELGKIVSASKTRIQSFLCDATHLQMVVNGAAGEVVGLAFVANDAPTTVLIGHCQLSTSGKSIVTVENGSVNCA